ncbi:repressor of RNA polymerase III transcription [Raphidocelis subcapitata]|uniref:Repressor of RNA polymerase III transcription n=1 Tax=Raphidocelis subcapitata TaxID=307507 RepID=A0A2V0P9A8_9CHLO|nr:repressor of RNA polymerase III transcription [Raphidocelis subcapitata]|eukprot:GBF96426.1 repressor of RNA polymerase III transcription [Raphidocelis subcapitata]
MRHLEDSNLARLNSFLESVDTGEFTVHGNLEAFSCKLAGLDKKLSQSLDGEVLTGSSPQQLSMSPVGPLSDSASRKTLIYLILTLNHVYPDYDFSQLRAQHFKKEPGFERAEEVVSTCLLDVGKVWEATPGFGDAPFLDSLMGAINEVIGLKESDVYSYKSDNETDPFGESANVWAFNYFFYNRKLKRILYLSCRAVPKGADDSEVGEGETSDEYEKYNSDGDDGGAAAAAPAAAAVEARPPGKTDYGMAAEMDL